MTEEGTPGSFDEDPFVIAVREYILATLTPLVPVGDSGGKFMYGLLRRALRSASKPDLEQVVLHCVAFTDGLRSNGFITEELARQASDYLNPGAIHDAIATDTDSSATDRAAIPGPGVTDRADSQWQKHTGQASDSGLSPNDADGDDQGMESPTDTGGGHQATLEGDSDPNGTEHAEAVSEDGPG